MWWDDLQNLVRQTARQKAAEFAAQGMRGVDLYLCGHTHVYSKHRNAGSAVWQVDAGNAGKHMRVFMDTHQPHTYMYSDDWGSVGAAFPIAMGAKLARPKQPVMAAVGDMGMMCNIGELETAVRERIPVVCVVFNDRGLGNERAFQKELYGGRYFGVDYGDVDFAALARVFGAFGERVEEPSAVLPAIKRALESGLPAVVDVIIDQDTLAAVVYKS